MAYNNYFPVNYQSQQFYPQMPQQQIPQFQQGQQVPQQGQYQQMQGQQPQPQMNQPMNSGIIWVQGEAGAKSYLVAPNTTVQLWDSENQTIYLKSADASGMPSIKTLDYTIREQQPGNMHLMPENGSQSYATKEDVEILASQLETLKNEFKAISARPVGRPKKEMTDNE